MRTRTSSRAMTLASRSRKKARRCGVQTASLIVRYIGSSGTGRYCCLEPHGLVLAGDSGETIEAA